MTPSEFLSAARARGVRLRIEDGQLLADGLDDAGRAFLAENANAVAALVALEDEMGWYEGEADRLVGEMAESRREEYREERRRMRRAEVAHYDTTRVRALVDAGRWGAGDVAEWAEAVRERVEREAEAMGLTLAAALRGRASREIRDAFGNLVGVEIGGMNNGYRSTYRYPEPRR